MTRTHLLTVVAVALATASPAAAAPNDPEGPPVDPGEPTTTPNLPPTAKARFSIEPRALASRDHWSGKVDNYSPSYARPSEWGVVLNGCGSTGGSDAHGNFLRVTFDWRLEPLDGQPEGTVTSTSTQCKSVGRVHALGRWHANLTVRNSAGRTAVADGGERNFRDIVVVALGDSYVSGEGNPEERKDFKNGRPIPAKWTDRQCHRSRASWTMRAATRFEDENTAVTFLNYGCSGATVDNILHAGYKGIEPLRGDTKLPAQVVAARDVLGAPLTTGSRSVHTVLMAVGVNDLGFSSILEACAAFNSGIHVDVPGTDLGLTDEPCDAGGSGWTHYVESGIAQLRESYDRLEVGLAANLSARAVRFVQYPSRILTNGRDKHGGCGALSGISSGEAHWISNRGDDLNAAMAAAAARNGWGYVGGIRDAFRGHGYCAKDTWFRSLTGSLALQDNRDGTAHPLWAGHARAGAIVAPTIPTEELPLSSPTRVQFEFKRVRVSSPPGEGYEIVRGNAPPIRPTFRVIWHGGYAVPPARDRSIELGKWVAVPEAGRVHTVDTLGNTIGIEGYVTLPALRYDNSTGREHEPRRGRGVESAASPGSAVTGLRRARMFVLHRRADGWRPGTHVVKASCNICSMELEYEVKVLPVLPTEVGPHASATAVR